MGLFVTKKITQGFFTKILITFLTKVDQKYIYQYKYFATKF